LSFLAAQVWYGHWIVVLKRAITQNLEFDLCIKQIGKRCLPAGGFSENLHGLYRPDSTAWAVLALAGIREHLSSTNSGRSILAASQSKDGSVAFPDAQDVYWPTAISVLAWLGSSLFDHATSQALSFLLETSGKHWSYDPQSPVAHDPSIKGWPWVAATHSFVDPTAMALLALNITGHSGHPRFRDGLDMLMNRQLPHGGWNYGNTLVYGKELHPFVDTTGIACTVLAGHIAKEQVSGSIRYLQAEAESSRTPLSLAWALFGLGAWGEFPDKGCTWIEETLKKQTKYGPYGTTLLSLLALAYLCRGDFRKCFA
jgi:hypothetical protein